LNISDAVNNKEVFTGVQHPESFGTIIKTLQQKPDEMSFLMDSGSGAGMTKRVTS
jgi:hypothetical protein